MAVDGWDLTPPPPSELGDREVPREGHHLDGKRIALMITGGIAAMKAPFIARALRRQGAEVVPFVSEEALRYVTVDVLEWSTTQRVIRRLTPEAEHLSDQAPFDAYLMAPATYNSINKLRYGIADGVITSALASALGRMEMGETKVLIAPTMHGSLHTSILTESLRTLEVLGVRIIPPREDYGKHNIPTEERLVAEVCRAVSGSPLRDMPLLVTGGPTPVPVDSVRRITNIFRGHLGVLIAEELYLRGADVDLIHGDGAYLPPAYLPHTITRTFQAYHDTVLKLLAARRHRAGIFSAAVADYQPREVLPGKTPSGGALGCLDLVPLPKVVEIVRERFPELYMVTFKYQEGMDHGELLELGESRLGLYEAVVVNQGDERGPEGEQIAHLMARGGGEVLRMVGKETIARALADHLEERLGAGEGAD